LGDVYVQEKRIAVSNLAWTRDVAMVDAVLRLSIYRADSSKVANMHEARARKMSDVIGEAIGFGKNCI